jgi:hypothetical protein
MKMKDEKKKRGAATPPQPPEASAAPVLPTEPPAPESAGQEDSPAAAAPPDPAAAPAPEPPADPAEQVADEQALLGNLTPTERAMVHWALEERHILKSREVELEDGSIEVRILTQGGQRVFYPRDQARVLSDMEKGDAVPNAPSAGIFSK